jgi:2-methylcitrate dehydratase
VEDLWKVLMLMPSDYSDQAIDNSVTKKIIEKIEFVHGGEEYDSKYPEGIPTSMLITTKDSEVLDSGMILFPGGHSRNEGVSLKDVLQYKFKKLGRTGLDK